MYEGFAGHSDKEALKRQKMISMHALGSGRCYVHFIIVAFK